jgi:hypothetical protein
MTRQAAAMNEFLPESAQRRPRHGKYHHNGKVPGRCEALRQVH